MYYRWHGTTDYHSEHYSEHYSEMPNSAATCPSYMPNVVLNEVLSHTATMLIPHIMKPYETSLWRSNDL